MTEKLRTEVEVDHNAVRSKVSPSASNMLDMGRNTYVTYDTQIVNFPNVIYKWFQTVAHYDFELNACTNSQSCHHFMNGDSQRLQILQWNAGGMSPVKKIQVQKILQTYVVDIFTIMEANISDDKLKNYQFSGYTLYNLAKYRQVASGILTGVKEGLTSHYDLIKNMGSTQTNVK
ncbi:unnamed protein product [Rodentolepis nana]|uniref:Plexin_cytopl domain-containing protein n=1 Tax=Rodentolepis nana TaxID=102285 RepID=A0A158QHU2_RODNA|nr:unnamed protein product [Rodentolepis nana]